jgi:PAS domain S-box-containing protein
VLQKVQEDYRALVENASDGIFTIDPGGRFTFLNKKALEMVGYTTEELVGSNFIMIVAPEHRASTIENFRKRLTGEAVDRYDIEVITKRGDRIRVELSTKTLEHNGEFMGVEGITREVVDID